MKKLLLGFMAVLLVAGGAAQAAGEEAFATGLERFKQSDYRAALERFEAAQAAGMEQPKLDYNIGVCQLKLDNYARARRAFLRSAQHPPLRDLSHYNIGLAETARGNDAEAKKWFRLVYNESDSAKLRALAKRRLDDAGQADAETAKRWFAGFSIAYGYDDNIEDPVQAGAADKGDSFTKLLLYTSGLLQGTNDDGIRLGLSGYFLRYQDVSAYDLNLLQARLDKRFSAGNWRNSIGVALEQTSLGNNDYLQTAKLTLSGELPLSARDELRLRYRYSSIASQDVLYDKLEGSRNEAQVRWQRKESGYRLRASYEYEVNDREDYRGATTFTSYSPVRNTFELRGDRDISANWELGGRLGYRNSRYADANVLADSSEVTRDDDRLLAGAELSRSLGGGLKGYLEYKYTDNDSNIDAYDYTRNLYSIGLAGSF